MSKQGVSKAKQKDAGITTHANQPSKRFDPRLEAAQKRIRESVNQADTFEAIREIVTNLLGCEEIGLFRAQSGKSGLMWSFGIDPQRHGTLDSFDKVALHQVMQGELHVAQLDREEEDHPPLRVFVPICQDGRTVAVLVMLRLLPQKVAFDEADMDLVKLLSQEAGKALFDRDTNAQANPRI